MSAKRTKRIIITGAGFSAPAQLPIQNRIIDKMTEEPELDFLSGNLPLENIKFLDAYIAVGLFLLNNYGKNSYGSLETEYNLICAARQARDYLNSENCKKRYEELGLGNLYSDFSKSLKSVGEEYSEICALRNTIRAAIKEEKISVNLEDIFTSFDKSVLSSEYVHRYTYSQMDIIRYSIMRLFSYYFSKGVIDHSFDQRDYKNFVGYIKSRRTANPVTIITTNWDTLLEEYFQRQNIKYYYGFQFPYTSEDFRDKIVNEKILLLKIHGSANWLKCLHCGAISVYKDNDAASFLFEDGKHECCSLCGAGENSNEPSLQPEIITPTMIKSLSNRLYSNLWGSAASEIRNATHIVFVGYSFPIADFDFRYMLQKNVPDTAKIDVVLYNDANPNQTDAVTLKSLLPEKRYRNAFPKNIVGFHYDGFGDFFNQGFR